VKKRKNNKERMKLMTEGEVTDVDDKEIKKQG
jgi:hypothetical protein